MQTKCGVCEKNCICSICKKSINCRYSTEDDCKVCLECGRYEPCGYIEVSKVFDESNELQRILQLKRGREVI